MTATRFALIAAAIAVVAVVAIRYLPTTSIRPGPGHPTQVGADADAKPDTAPGKPADLGGC